MIILDLFDQFAKQNSIDTFSQFLVFWAYKKYSLKPQTAKFCQSFEYSLDVHCKVYKELAFLKIFCNLEKNREIVRFYLKSRKILMQFFFGDGSYHDAETTKLELEHWVNITSRIFAEISAKSIEKVNNAVIRQAVQGNANTIRKTIDAVSFLEHCVIEYLKLKNLVANDQTARSTSPIRSPEIQDKVETPIKGRSMQTNTSSPNLISPYGRGQPSSRDVSPNQGRLSGQKPLSAKLDLSSPNSYKIMKHQDLTPERLAKTSSTLIIENYERGSQNQSVSPIIESPEKKSGSFIAQEPSPVKSPIRDKTLQELKKEKIFLTNELQEQCNERKRVEDGLEKVLTEFTDLSEKHDHLVDFTVELQKNFLFLVEHLKSNNSSLMEDQEVQEAYQRVSDFNSYETNYLERLSRASAMKDREQFLIAAKQKTKNR